MALTSTRTALAYAVDVERVRDWCIERGIPLDAGGVLCWAASALEEGVARSTVRRRLYACRHHGLLDGVSVASVLRQHAELVQRAGRRARPLWPEQIRTAVVELLDAGRVLHGALLLVGYCGAMRRSELARLRWDWIEWREDEAIVRLPSSKWRPEGRAICLPIGQVPICPVHLLRRVQELRADDGLVFGLSDRAVDRLVKARFGLDYSAHSLRAGWISTAALLGTPEWMMADHTGIRDHDTLHGYIREAEGGMGRAARHVLSSVVLSRGRADLARVIKP